MLKDFYNEYDPEKVTDQQRKEFEKFKSELSDKDKAMLENTDLYYRVSFKNVGGLIMPILLMVTFEDGSTREIRIPAEAWRMDNNKYDTLIIADKPLKTLELDPYRETADVDRNNNYFPPVIESSKFQIFKSRRGGRGPGEPDSNPMQAAKAAEAKKAEQPKGPESTSAVIDKSDATPKAEVKSQDEPKKSKKNKKNKKKEKDE